MLHQIQNPVRRDAVFLGFTGAVDFDVALDDPVKLPRLGG